MHTHVKKNRGYFMTPHYPNILTIANRDPVDKKDAYTPYWLNNHSHELFQFIGEWISVTNKYISTYEKL